ncbi:MAG: outer membrane beta-barrel protein [Candidatus Polarisedimenticolia bacterium]
MRGAWRRFAGRPLVALVMVLAGAGEARARSEDGSWEFGGAVLYSRFPNESTIDEDIGYGVRAGYSFRALDALEFELTRVSTDHSEVDGVSFDVDRMVVSWIRNFTPKASPKLSPFLRGGLGRIAVEASSTGGPSAEDTATLLRFGGGMRAFFTERLAFRVDGSLSHWRGEGGAVPKEGQLTFDLAVGLSFITKGGK